MDFDFTQPYSNGILNGDDLKFFYYDIGRDNLQGLPDIYDWNAVISKFSGIIDIATCDNDQICSSFKENFIRFSVDQQKDNGNITSAFFRHLRNAFSHYRIVRVGKWYEITDISGENYSMRGKIDADLLKELCFCLFDQREKIISSQVNPLKINGHE